tara:strand:+ start:144278 stop:146611 length:2334 start_codon:yes stop_codon:yes gene_type:complete
MGKTFLKTTFAHTLSILLLLLMGNLGVAQIHSQLSGEEKRKLRLRSQPVVDIRGIPDTIAFSNGKRSQLAVYIDRYTKDMDRKFRQLSDKVDLILILGDVNVPEGILDPGKVLFIPPDVLEHVTINEGAGEVDPREMRSWKELLRMVPLKELIYKDSIFIRFWNDTGRMPNFIQVPFSQLSIADSLVGTLNKMQKVYGAVRSQQGPLDGVGIKNYGEATVNGYFTFPVLDKNNLPILIPHKAGYYFSPDILYTTPENIDNSKEFMGFPLAFEYGLTDHFVFRKSIENSIRKNNKELISNNIKVKKDSQFGTIGYFDGKAYIDAGINSRNSLQGSFSITAWIRPNALDNNNSILGKGDNFVLKLHNGFLTFTMADIKDYVSQGSPVPIGQWTQVGLVHFAVYNELHFFVNGKLTDRIKLIAKYDTSNYNLLIGSNLWQEFFKGDMADIKIWDRELNVAEIAQEFRGMGKHHGNSTLGLFQWLWLLPISFVMFVLVRYLKKSKVKKVQPIVPIAKLPETMEYRERICCFGTLRILDGQGNDMAKKLSPKLKQLFVLVLLHSVNDGKGVSTAQLSDFLWPGMGASGAKNTRGTSIQNLRAVLADCKGMELVFRDKCWFLDLTEDCYCDYGRVLLLLDHLREEGLSIAEFRGKLSELLTILKNGRFLSSMDSQWLDPYLEALGNQIMELFSVGSKKLNVQNDAALMYDFAMVVYLYDDLNENALRVKIRILMNEGKYSLARAAYDSFIKLYGKLYAEPYLTKFEDIISINEMDPLKMDKEN